MNEFIAELLDNNEDIVLVGVANVVDSSWFNHDVPFVAKRSSDDEWILFHSDVEEDTLAGHQITIESATYSTKEVCDLFNDLPISLYVFVGKSVPDYIGNDNKEEVWDSVLNTDQLPDYIPDSDCIFRYRQRRF